MYLYICLVFVWLRWLKEGVDARILDHRAYV